MSSLRLVLALTATLISLPALAQNGIAHLTAIKGNVTVRHGDSGPWVPAPLNTPLATGDFLSTSSSARADVQLDSFHTLRVAGSGEIVFTRSEYENYQVSLTRGSLTYRVLGSSPAVSAIDTPSVSVAPSREGLFRIGLLHGGESEIVAEQGEVMVYAPSGSMWLEEGQKLRARGNPNDPEFRLMRRWHVWKRMAQILGNIQLAAAIGAVGGGGDSSSWRKPETKSNSPTGKSGNPKEVKQSWHEPPPGSKSTHSEASSHSSSSGGHSSIRSAGSSGASSSSHTASAPSSSNSSSSSAHGK